MKVAIIGAGISGLACAHELQRQNIIPTVFEKKDYTGEALDFPALGLRLFSTPIKDPLKFLLNKYKLQIQPDYDISEINLIGPRSTYKFKAKFGISFKRGVEADSLEKRLAKTIDVPIKYNTAINIDDIKHLYDYIVVATGDNIIANQIGLSTVQFSAHVRIATIKGIFSANVVNLWFNTDYAKHGYAYMVANRHDDARVIMIVDDVEVDEFEQYWNKFINANFSGYELSDIKDLRHTVGMPTNLQKDNIYLVGNAGGFIDSFLGFGVIPSLLSGVSAGHCIANNFDYNRFMNETIQDLKHKYEFRKAYNKLDNNEIEKLLAFISYPGIKQFIYSMSFMKTTYGTLPAKMFNKIKS